MNRKLYGESASSTQEPDQTPRESDEEPAAKVEVVDAHLRAQFQAQATKHWIKYLPHRSAELLREGEFSQAVRTAARRAAQTVKELIAQGYQAHEAEEVARHEYILLRPEAKAGLEPWEIAELAALDRKYATTGNP